MAERTAEIDVDGTPEDVWVGGEPVVVDRQHRSIDVAQARDEVGRRAARLAAVA